jgi:hypothetical protein
MTGTSEAADMVEPITVEQQMLYKSMAASQLTQALLSLWATEKLCARCGASSDTLSALIRDALVLYGSAWRYSDVANGGAPEVSTVPQQFEALHRDLIAYRDRFFAHFDSTFGSHATAADRDGLSWHGDAKGPFDFEDEIPQIKALILEILSEKLWPDLLGEHEALAHKCDL